MTKKEKKIEKKSSSSLKSYARFSSIAIQMAIIIGLGSWSGMKIDEKLINNTPFFTIILSLSSVALSLYLVIKEVIKMGNNDE